MEIEHITNAQWEIMRVVWTKKATTSSEIISVLKDRFNWQPSTVKTLLNRLVEKHFLAAQKQGNRFIYHPLVTEKESTIAMTKDLKEKLCQRKIPLFLETLIETSDFTQKNIDTLITLLEKKREQAVEYIPCNCLPDKKKTSHCCC